MRRCFLGLGALIFFTLQPQSVSAHHSFSNYDMKTDTTLTGIVTRFEWTNPHAYLYLNVVDTNGVPKEWAIEFAAVGHLLRMGLTKDAFKPGDQVTVVGHLARNGSNVLTFSTITTAAGRAFRSGPSAATSPTQP